MKEQYLALLLSLQENDGATLKRGKTVNYKTGWQVADFGIETKSAMEAAEKIMEMNGSCGIWYSEGIYYIDHSFRIKTKKEALAIGRAHNQISILKWETMELVYC